MQVLVIRVFQDIQEFLNLMERIQEARRVIAKLKELLEMT